MRGKRQIGEIYKTAISVGKKGDRLSFFNRGKAGCFRDFPLIPTLLAANFN